MRVWFGRSFFTLGPLGGCLSFGEIDPCAVDHDEDGVADCEDDDDDGDGLSDLEERELGTDPLDADSDHDGLDDSTETSTQWPYHPAGAYQPAMTATDPAVATLLVEVDWMQGYRPAPEVIAIAEKAFASVDIEAFFLLSEAPLAVENVLSSPARMEAVLGEGDDEVAHLHVVFGAYGENGEHGTTYFALPNDPSSGRHPDVPSPEAAGSFVFAQQVLDDFDRWSGDFVAAGITADHLMARTLVHELGHLVGCTHEGTEGGIDADNVMVSNGALGSPSSNATGWRAATLGADGAGHPSFSDGALAQMDLQRKASVEVGTSVLGWAFDMGGEATEVAAGFVGISELDVYDHALGYGWTPPVPNTPVEGSMSGDPRTADAVSGDPALLGETVFDLVGVGTGAVSIFLRVGGVLEQAREVRCELLGGAPLLEGPLRAGGDALQTTDLGELAHPHVESNALGFEQGRLRIRCLDGGPYGDAPIELLWVAKRDP